MTGAVVLAFIITMVMFFAVVVTSPDNSKHLDHSGNGAFQPWLLAVATIGVLGLSARTLRRIPRNVWIVACSLYLLVFASLGVWTGRLATKAWRAECGPTGAVAELPPMPGCLGGWNPFGTLLAVTLSVGVSVVGWALFLRPNVAGKTALA